MTKRAFGELESQILCILKTGERKTVKEVQQALGGKDNYNTVMTVMSPLTEKERKFNGGGAPHPIELPILSQRIHMSRERTA